MALDKLISSDSHLIEHPTLWEERIDRRFVDRGPRVVRVDGFDWWYVDGRKTMSFLGIQTGRRFDKDPSKLVTQSRFEEVRPGAYDPKLFVKESEEDGVLGSVLYPTEGLVLFSIPDSELLSAAMRAYNSYIAEFCSDAPDKLKGIGMVNVDDPAEGAAELERCRELGLVGALITVQPPANAPYDHPMYEPLWSAAEDLQMPLSLHTATQRANPQGVGGAPADVQNAPPSIFVLLDTSIRKSLAEMIYGGVFERHPRLRVGTVEHELAWIPHFLQQLDYTYTDRPARGPAWKRFADPEVLPSDFFHRNVFASFQEDPLGIRERDLIGVTALMWGSDYPHTESTFPRSRQVLAEILDGVPEDEQRRIACTNAAELYGFDLGALGVLGAA
jgi:predicted TIM-barrel fold metal-dependent hydrolase